MNNVRRLFVVVLLAITFMALAQPVFATHAWFITGVRCDPSTNTITIYGYIEDESSVSSEVFVNGSFLGEYDADNEPDSGSFSYTVTHSSFVEGAIILVQNDIGEEGQEMLSASTVCGKEVECINPDDRLNPVCNNPEQSFAVYCRNGNIVVFAVDGGKGTFAFTVTPEELDEFDEEPATNTLIEQGLGARFYILTTGEYQINRVKPDGKDYVFIFDGC